MANSKLHFKMYKAGKQWLVAGLSLFAVSLTLGATTVAHADANADTTSEPVSAEKNASATTSPINQSSTTLKSTPVTKENSESAATKADSVANQAPESTEVKPVSQATGATTSTSVDAGSHTLKPAATLVNLTAEQIKSTKAALQAQAQVTGQPVAMAAVADTTAPVSMQKLSDLFPDSIIRKNVIFAIQHFANNGVTHDNQSDPNKWSVDPTTLSAIINLQGFNDADPDHRVVDLTGLQLLTGLQKTKNGGLYLNGLNIDDTAGANKNIGILNAFLKANPNLSGDLHLNGIGLHEVPDISNNPNINILILTDNKITSFSSDKLAPNNVLNGIQLGNNAVTR